MIQTRCSVFNVHVSKKREQEAMKVGNEFGSTLRAKPVEQCDLYFAFIRNTSWEFLIPNRSVEKHRAFLVLAFSSEENPITSLNCQSDSGRRHGEVFLVDD